MILDIIAIAFTAVMCIIGAKKGILKMLLRLSSWVLSVILAWLFYTPVAEFLKNTPIADYIREAVRTGIVEPRLDSAQSAVPEIFRGVFDAGAASGADAAAAGISEVILSVLAFVLTLILCRIIMSVLGSLLHLVSRLPVIKQCNRLLGGILGALEGILILYIAAAIIFISAPVNNSDFFREQLSQSTAASEIYNNNFIINFFTNDKFNKAHGGANQRSDAKYLLFNSNQQ